MSFVLEQSPTFKHPVSIREVLDGGKRTTETFTATFAWLKQSRIDEIKRLADRLDAGRYSSDDEETEGLTNISACREILIDWSDVVDDDGDEVPFTAQALTELVEIPTVAAQIVMQWAKSLDAAKKKN